ncbi:MAG: hypothetical protein EOO75_09735 [Myxococcales bacterium]|nr:MAG: hypothetical protein EOO75_09735 [Myxococcales bacterium]
MTALRIALDSIDRHSFKVSELQGEVMIQPHRTKHRWGDEELAWRSLVTDPEGRVRSAAWPKFFNHGEHAGHDAEFARALAAGGVEFVEKIDGTLLVADARRGGARLRTRGQPGLGEFEAPVRALIARRYPGLLTWLSDERDPHVGGLSLLFEYVAPDHTIVVRYAEPALVFIGAVDKATLAPRWDAELAARVERQTGIRPAPAHALPSGLDAVLGHVRALRGREGLVARFRDAAGRPRLLKLKSDEFVRIHGQRATLGERGARRLALLLDIRSEADIAPAFARVGLDHEAATYAAGSLRGFFAELTAGEERLGRVHELLGPPGSWGDRRAFVDHATLQLATDRALSDSLWFRVALKLHERRPDEAWRLVLASLVDEPVATVRAWLAEREATVAALLAARAPAEE